MCSMFKWITKQSLLISWHNSIIIALVDNSMGLWENSIHVLYYSHYDIWTSLYLSGIEMLTKANACRYKCRCSETHKESNHIFSKCFARIVLCSTTWRSYPRSVVLEHQNLKLDLQWFIYLGIGTTESINFIWLILTSQ